MALLTRSLCTLCLLGLQGEFTMHCTPGRCIGKETFRCLLSAGIQPRLGVSLLSSFSLSLSLLSPYIPPITLMVLDLLFIFFRSPCSKRVKTKMKLSRQYICALTYSTNEQNEKPHPLRAKKNRTADCYSGAHTTQIFLFSKQCNMQKYLLFRKRMMQDRSTDARM